MRRTLSHLRLSPTGHDTPIWFGGHLVDAIAPMAWVCYMAFLRSATIGASPLGLAPIRLVLAVALCRWAGAPHNYSRLCRWAGRESFYVIFHLELLVL